MRGSQPTRGAGKRRPSISAKTSTSASQAGIVKAAANPRNPEPANEARQQQPNRPRRQSKSQRRRRLQAALIERGQSEGESLARHRHCGHHIGNTRSASKPSSSASGFTYPMPPAPASQRAHIVGNQVVAAIESCRRLRHAASHSAPREGLRPAAAWATPACAARAPECSYKSSGSIRMARTSAHAAASNPSGIGAIFASSSSPRAGPAWCRSKFAALQLLRDKPRESEQNLSQLRFRQGTCPQIHRVLGAKTVNQPAAPGARHRSSPAALPCIPAAQPACAEAYG